MPVKQRAMLGGRKRSHRSSFFSLLDLKESDLRAGWLLLLFGFLAITAGIYSALQRDGDGEIFPIVTIFAAPRPFLYSGGRPDLLGERQELAVRSWLGLTPEISVVLFGKDSSIFDMARVLGSRVVVDSHIDFTFVGTPFFHCMVKRAQNFSSAISVIIDPETILLPNFLTALHCAYKLDRDWFLVSMIPSVSNFPFSMDDTGNRWLKEVGTSMGIGEVQQHTIKELQWRNCGEKLLMAWNNGEVPLFAGILPPFIHGKGFHNSWLLNEALSSEFRLVIDSSYIASAIHPENCTHHFERNILSDTNNDGWEVKINLYLAASYGSLYSEEQNMPTTDFNYIKCSGKHILHDSVKKVVLYDEGSRRRPFGFNYWMIFLLRRFLHFGIQQKLIHCIEGLNFLGSQWLLKKIYLIAFTRSLTLPNPFNLESLLQITADKDKTIVLAVSGDNYKDMLMSWVCRLRYLNVSNFIVCALDAETYQFALLLGLPVFRDPLAPNVSFNDCHFGTDCFQRVTKVKSRIVLQILKLGYNVLLSDVDVYWFSNPLTYLQSFGPAILAAQSDEYNETEDNSEMDHEEGERLTIIPSPVEAASVETQD